MVTKDYGADGGLDRLYAEELFIGKNAALLLLTTLASILTKAHPIVPKAHKQYD
jgi:hypothetical protein